MPTLGDGAHRRNAGGNCLLRGRHAPRANTPSGRLCCWRSPRCSIRRERRKANTLPGRIVTCPNGSQVDMLPRIEAQIERFAPGFRDCILERRVFSPASLESMDANLMGGDIGGGLMSLPQFLFRPTRRFYATSAREIYICSSSTPPGGGVHGMCGYNAAKLALTTPVTNAPDLGKRGKIAVALSLTVVGGFVDAVGYIALFEIFTANMSGNSVHRGNVSRPAKLDGVAASALRDCVLRCGNGLDEDCGRDCRARRAAADRVVYPGGRSCCCSPSSRMPPRRCTWDRLSISNPRLLLAWWPCWHLPWGCRPRH